MSGRLGRAGDRLLLVALAARTLGGRWYWVLPLTPLAWTALLALFALGGSQYEPADAQVWLLGLPLGALAVALGVRIIGGEVDASTLEIAYTVPGGEWRIWLARFAAGVILLAAADLLLAAVTFVFLTELGFGAVYGAFQGAVVMLALGMGLGALLRGTITAAMVATPLLALAVMTGATSSPGLARISPLYDPLHSRDAAPADVIAWTVQNRLAMVLVVVALVALACSRAARRERMIS